MDESHLSALPSRRPPPFLGSCRCPGAFEIMKTQAQCPACGASLRDAKCPVCAGKHPPPWPWLASCAILLALVLAVLPHLLTPHHLAHLPQPPQQQQQQQSPEQSPASSEQGAASPVPTVTVPPTANEADTISTTRRSPEEALTDPADATDATGAHARSGQTVHEVRPAGKRTDIIEQAAIDGE